MRGVIKNIIEDKGFGFIKVTDGTEFFFHKSDYLGHWNDIVEDRKSGQIEVEFDVVKSQKGPRASNVKRINEITG